MVRFPPLAPSVGWYAHWLASFRDIHDDTRAIACANEMTGVSGKNLARCVIGTKESPLMLSAALSGGSQILKKISRLDSIPLSDHGNWRHIHLGAFEAILGKTPFYIHYIPELREIYGARIATLEEFNLEIHRFVKSSLLNNTDVTPSPCAFPPSVAERGMEIAGMILPDHSVIEALMSHGPETLLSLDAIYSR